MRKLSRKNVRRIEIPLVSASKAICWESFIAVFIFINRALVQLVNLSPQRTWFFFGKNGHDFFFLFFSRNLRSTCRFSKAFRPQSSTLGAIKKRKRSFAGFSLRISRDSRSWFQWLLSPFLQWLSNARKFTRCSFSPNAINFFFLHAISKRKALLTDNNRAALKSMHLKRWFGW